ncbi:MAG TPA: ABC transporter ATP-binding protein [Acidimicrobiia bacterium]|jgi:thiamine transport system ATP-binding protein|nr:ABC transporter ATP-binding protein [Acidimicrobiia bacterium]
MLELSALTVSYDGFVAVAGVDLEVRDGEIVCILGPSGSGKSSLLRAVAGLEPDARGRVAWDGADLARVPPHRRGFGLMFQDHVLFPHRDVHGNVAFGLRMQRLPRAEIETRTRDALALVGLSGFERRRIRELSGGEQQRVALARALAAEPRLLMLDEPLGALDRALRERLVTELRSLFVRLGLTTLFVTHDHDEAFALADRLVVMHEGRIEQIGTPAAVWQRPANAFVAQFLGWNVTSAFSGRCSAVRPEDIRVVPPGAPGGVVGTVSARTFRRDHFLLVVHVDDPDGAEPVQVQVSVHAGWIPDIGERVGLAAEGLVVLADG